jgi:excisionase family DNA binding protein
MSAAVLQIPDAVLDEIARRAAAIVVAQESHAGASPWLDTKGAADYIAASPGRVHDLVQLGKLTPRRDGRRLLFRAEDLDRYIEGNG